MFLSSYTEGKSKIPLPFHINKKQNSFFLLQLSNKTTQILVTINIFHLTKKKNTSYSSITISPTLQNTNRQYTQESTYTQKEQVRTNLNGSNTKTTSLEDETNTTSSNSFAKPTNNSTSYQNILHLYSTSSVLRAKRQH